MGVVTNGLGLGLLGALAVAPGHVMAAVDVFISNPRGVVFQTAPQALGTCGVNCFRYEAGTVAFTLPTGFSVTGCRRASAGLCNVSVTQNSQRLRVYPISVVVLATSSATLVDEIFSNGFEGSGAPDQREE